MIESKDLHHNGLYEYDGRIWQLKISASSWLHELDGSDQTGCTKKRRESINPIQITPSWLEEFGWDLHENDGKPFYAKTWGSNNVGVEIIQPETPYPNGMAYNLGKGKTKIIYNVHKLQNLFFALTESELELKQLTESA